MCKDSNEDEWIYVIRTGSCRIIKALTQVTPKLRTKKIPKVIYDNFGTKRHSQYGMEALGTFSRVKTLNDVQRDRFYSLIPFSQKHQPNSPNVTPKLNKFESEAFS